MYNKMLTVVLEIWFLKLDLFIVIKFSTGNMFYFYFIKEKIKV